MSQQFPVDVPGSATHRRTRFADLRLRTKVLSLVGVAAVVTVSLAGVAQTALADAERTATAIVEDAAQPAVTAGDAARAWARYRRFTLQLVVAPDDAANTKALAGLDRQIAVIDTAFVDYAATNITAVERTDLEALRTRYKAVVQLWETELEPAAVAAKDPTAVAKVIAGVDRDFVPPADAVSLGFEALVDGQEKAMATAVREGSAAATRATQMLWGGAFLGLLVVAGLGWWIAGMVSRPIGHVKRAIDGLAEGDLTVAVAVDSRDEVGQMAAALTRAQAALRESMSTIVTSSATLAGSAEELSAVSAQVAASAEETSVQSGTAAAAAEQVSRNVQTVAAATEQMSASIREISQSSTEAVRVAQSAADEARNATGTVSKLGDSSREIGDVVKVITSIAEQTNLLALNATIEAARAGEAGKGFAVVASEVKDLAQETARATEDISKRIEAIQTDSEAAVAAIARISEIIEEVNSYQTTIASAVEEQTATTSEMSRNVQEAANGAGGIAGNIEYVATAAQSSSTGIVEAQRAAAELAQLSGDLRELVSRYQV